MESVTVSEAPDVLAVTPRAVPWILTELSAVVPEPVTKPFVPVIRMRGVPDVPCKVWLLSSVKSPETL